jgi:hypothetical protein
VYRKRRVKHLRNLKGQRVYHKIKPHFPISALLSYELLASIRFNFSSSVLFCTCQALSTKVSQFEAQPSAGLKASLASGFTLFRISLSPYTRSRLFQSKTLYCESSRAASPFIFARVLPIAPFLGFNQLLKSCDHDMRCCEIQFQTKNYTNNKPRNHGLQWRAGSGTPCAIRRLSASR